ncbi:MAG: putative DNA binding domain-containing protein [Candidatus Nanopelagicales bacterium]|nr:putative DNA binding domain-containing protein [Candidatus Nanopelagicales bacterium]
MNPRYVAFGSASRRCLANPSMKPAELTALLDRLIAAGENEVVEFKEAGDNFSTSDIGKYFSALANEANLRSTDAGWLVFGVSDARVVVGTDYRIDAERLHSLKKQISDGAGASFREIHELKHPGGRVLLLEIPPAPRGIPIGWNGHCFARAGEHLVALSDVKRDEIRKQGIADDWTAAVVPQATSDHLDPAAIVRARHGFAERYSARVPPADIAAWDDATFLAKAQLTRDGGVTRAALLLLGKDSSSQLLSPHPAQLTWKLVGQEHGYEHFRLPFLLNATAVYRRIRNIQLRLLPPGELIYREISKYDERSVLEALYNCIAHQDYRQNSRIIVTEFPDRVEFISVGEFYDGQPDDYVRGELTPRKYRNPFLVEAMTQLNLIDHMGYGIHRMITDQVRRFLPLPDYDLSRAGEVSLTIPGAVIDEAYSQLLMLRTDLEFDDILALDRVQKSLSLPAATTRRLRRAGLIEGRKPHIHVAASVAGASGAKAEYIRTRRQTDDHYAKLVTDYLTEYGSADRRDLETLLLAVLSDALSDQQKRNKVSNLLGKLRRGGVIRNAGSRQKPRWELG